MRHNNVRLDGYQMDPVGGMRFSPPRKSQIQRRQQQFGQQPPGHQAVGDLPVLQTGGGPNHQARIGGHGSGRAGVRRNIRRGSGDVDGVADIVGEQEVRHPQSVQHRPLGPPQLPRLPPVHPQLPDVPAADQHIPLGPPEGKEDLSPWLDPEVPGPFIGPVHDDADGWARMDWGVGVWTLFI